MAVDNLSKRISDLTQYLEDLKTRGISEPGNTAEILSDAVDELQISLEELLTAEEELYRQNEDLIESKEALRESEERYRTLFESMTEGFALHEIICDEKGEPSDYRFININPAFERLTGLKREDVIGKTMRMLPPRRNNFKLNE